MIKAIVFDFDGVVVRRSEFFKQESWGSVFQKYGEKGNAAFREAEQLYGGGRGGDRFEILRHAFETLGESKEHIDALITDGARLFDRQVQGRISEVGVSFADTEFIERLSKKFPLYLNSATPKDALEQTASTLNIRNFFKDVLGRPNTKTQNFSLVAMEEKAAPGEILFIGDSESDIQAAKEFGCRFMGLANDWNKWKANEKPFPVIENLAQILVYID